MDRKLDTHLWTKAIHSGMFHVVIMNPEIATRHGGYCEALLWSHRPFIAQLLNIIFDEGHCISQWGDTFREEYADVRKLQFLLPNIPFYVTSATLPPAILDSISQTLHMPRNTKML